MERHLQRTAPSSITNLEESLHEWVYKLAGRWQPLVDAMTGETFVYMRDIDDVDNCCDAGARTSVGRGVLPKLHRRYRRKQWARGGGMESAVNEYPVVDGHRRRFCHRASLVAFRRFGGDTVWCPIETAAYDLEWPGGDLATQVSVRMACPTAKTTRIKLTWPSPRLVHHYNDAISRIQEGPRPQCTQAR